MRQLLRDSAKEIEDVKDRDFVEVIGRINYSLDNAFEKQCRSR
jgi:hypothetical protein